MFQGGGNDTMKLGGGGREHFTFHMLPWELHVKQRQSKLYMLLAEEARAE
jgi:hypothetical protein